MSPKEMVESFIAHLVSQTGGAVGGRWRGMAQE